jgi:hypothetical protein
MSEEQLIQLCIEAPVAVLIAVLVIVLFAELKRLDAKTKLQDQERAQADKERADREARREQEEAAKWAQQVAMIETLVKNQDNLPVKVHSKEEEEKVGKLNGFIREQIDHLRADTGANRVGFYYFHNGGYSSNGIPFAKMSLYLESLDASSAPVMTLYQNMPQQLMPGVIHEIADDGKYYISDIDEIQDADSSTYHILAARGTRHALIQGVRDNLKQMYLGFISVEYSTSDPIKSLEETEVDLSKAAQRISGAMQIYSGTDLKKEMKKEGIDGK